VFLLGLGGGMLLDRGATETRHRVLAAAFFGLGVVLLAAGLGAWRRG
jgi:hypothetical protein